MPLIARVKAPYPQRQEESGRRHWVRDAGSVQMGIQWDKKGSGEIDI